MEGSALQHRDDHFELLMDYVRDTSYPSGELLNRIEGSIRTPDMAERYIEVLREKVLVSKIAPSLDLLNRLDRIIKRLELAEVRRKLASQS